MVVYDDLGMVGEICMDLWDEIELFFLSDHLWSSSSKVTIEDRKLFSGQSIMSLHSVSTSTPTLRFLLLLLVASAGSDVVSPIKQLIEDCCILIMEHHSPLTVEHFTLSVVFTLG